MVRATSVPVDDQGVELVPAEGDGVRYKFLNLGPATVYVGEESTTTGDGMPFALDGSDEGFLGPGESLHAITAAGQSAEVRVLRLGAV